MAQINAMIHLDRIHGKYAKTDKVYIRVRKFDNQLIGVALKNPTTNENPTTAQQTVMDKFATVHAQVDAILADETKREQYNKKYLHQRRCKTLRGYIFRQLYNSSEGN